MALARVDRLSFAYPGVERAVLDDRLADRALMMSMPLIWSSYQCQSWMRSMRRPFDRNRVSSRFAAGCFNVANRVVAWHRLVQAQRRHFP